MKKQQLLQQAASLFSEESHFISLLANASAFLNEHLININWVGFYLFDGHDLRVGPFQGKVACNLIKIGHGVCGTAYEKAETIVVDDVHQFSGHIACDPVSLSEVVVPLKTSTHGLIGVLDIDSPIYQRFDFETVDFIEAFVSLLVKTIDNMTFIY